MQHIFENAVLYSIEFIKLILAVMYFFNISPKKNINYAFFGSLILTMAVSIPFNSSDISIVYDFIAILCIIVFSEGKHRLGIVTLCFVGISIIDMLFSNIFINIFDMSTDEILDNSLIEMCINSISLIFIGIVILIVKHKRKNIPEISVKMLPIFLTGGLALSVYLSGLQFMGMGEAYLSYRYIIVLGLSLAAIIFIIICILLVYNQDKNSKLKLENEMNNKLLELQSDYYLMLLEKESETKAFRHDIKSHITCIKLLCKENKYDELEKYICELDEEVADLSPKFNTGNDYINAIATDLSAKYENVELIWHGKTPSLKISYIDICTLFYNLLKNAFEAADRCDDKIVNADIKVHNSDLLICISNNYNNILISENGELITTKTEENHGYGVGNIKKCVEKYGGSFVVTTEDNLFSTEIILPNVI